MADRASTGRGDRSLLASTGSLTATVDASRAAARPICTGRPAPPGGYLLAGPACTRPASCIATCSRDLRSSSTVPAWTRRGGQRAGHSPADSARPSSANGDTPPARTLASPSRRTQWPQHQALQQPWGRARALASASSRLGIHHPIARHPLAEEAVGDLRPLAHSTRVVVVQPRARCGTEGTPRA
jgi:hypothetical protein